MAALAVGVSDLSDKRFDVVIFINDDADEGCAKDAAVYEALKSFSKINPNLGSELSIVPFPAHPSGRLIYSPTGALNTDTADIRNVYDAACAGVKRALSMGCHAPLLYLGSLRSASFGFEWMQRKHLLLNALLGAYHALYLPLEVREMRPTTGLKAQHLGVKEDTKGSDELVLRLAMALEEGRWLARDIGGSDPERMAAPRIVDYLKTSLGGMKGITMSVEKVDIQKYPLMAAVNRAASVVARHDGRVVHLKYEPPNPTEVDTTLYLIGKGITYDTGGADIKANGVMAGMHRDKCGAAAIAGLFKTLGELQPPGLSVSAALAFVRNSVGADSYVADEILVARSGQRIRVGNTDAEGRMVMTDLLCEAKEKAINATNPFLFTIATLTGHVVRAYKHYTSHLGARMGTRRLLFVLQNGELQKAQNLHSEVTGTQPKRAVMDNGPARIHRVSQSLQEAGDRISDMAEISTVRKEDYEFNRGKTEYEDILQCNNLPSSATPRGHQIPAAFMALASGLDKHGLGSAKPIPYTHVDVAGSAAEIHVLPTAAPLLMFASRYVLPRLGFK